MAANIPEAWRQCLAQPVLKFIDQLIANNQELTKERDELRDELREVKELLEDTAYEDMTVSQAITVMLDELQEDYDALELEQTMQAVNKMAATWRV